MHFKENAHTGHQTAHGTLSWSVISDLDSLHKFAHHSENHEKDFKWFPHYIITNKQPDEKLKFNSSSDRVKSNHLMCD